MSIDIEKLLSPALGHPGQFHTQEAEYRLNISVVFTSVESTLTALRKAAALATSLRARITLLVPQVVPIPLPLENPPVLVDFNEKRFRLIAGQCPVETRVRIYLCRDNLQALSSFLSPGSIVVLGGRKRRWWPSPDARLARKLSRAGFEVIFTETE
jgi:hypothetical protein